MFSVSCCRFRLFSIILLLCRSSVSICFFSLFFPFLLSANFSPNLLLENSVVSAAKLCRAQRKKLKKIQFSALQVFGFFGCFLGACLFIYFSAAAVPGSPSCGALFCSSDGFAFADFSLHPELLFSSFQTPLHPLCCKLVRNRVHAPRVPRRHAALKAAGRLAAAGIKLPRIHISNANFFPLFIFVLIYFSLQPRY